MLNKTKVFFRSNGSTILTWIGAAGVVATTVLAVKATPKAIRLVEKAQEEKGDELTNKEVVLTVGPAYIPAVVVGVSTITCIFGANVLNKRQQAALTSAYALLNSTYKEYRNKVTEMLGEEANDEIDAELAKDKIVDIDDANKEQLFYDVFSDRYFESTLFKVQQAEYYLNRDLVMQDWAYLNDFYGYLEIDPVDDGDVVGWSTGACLAAYWQPWVDFNHEKKVTENGEECIHVRFWQEPFADFENYM